MSQMARANKKEGKEGRNNESKECIKGCKTKPPKGRGQEERPPRPQPPHGQGGPRSISIPERETKRSEKVRVWIWSDWKMELEIQGGVSSEEQVSQDHNHITDAAQPSMPLLLLRSMAQRRRFSLFQQFVAAVFFRLLFCAALSFTPATPLLLLFGFFGFQAGAFDDAATPLLPAIWRGAADGAADAAIMAYAIITFFIIAFIFAAAFVKEVFEQKKETLGACHAAKCARRYKERGEMLRRCHVMLCCKQQAASKRF